MKIDHKSFIILFIDVQELQHAVSAQQIVSPHPYKKDYKEQIVGKGPHDPTIGYPEHDHHKKVGELASSVRLLLLKFLKFNLKFYRANFVGISFGLEKLAERFKGT